MSPCPFTPHEEDLDISSEFARDKPDSPDEPLWTPLVDVSVVEEQGEQLLVPAPRGMNRMQKIRFVSPNPKKPGTKTHKRWEDYHSATTVGQALDHGQASLVSEQEADQLMFTMVEEFLVDKMLMEEEEESQVMSDDELTVSSELRTDGPGGAEAFFEDAFLEELCDDLVHDEHDQQLPFGIPEEPEVVDDNTAWQSYRVAMSIDIRPWTPQEMAALRRGVIPEQPFDL